MKTSVDARRSYQETALGGATPVELVVALYDTTIEDMRRAQLAMQRKDIETSVRQIGHALIVLQQLQGTLDFERGGDASRQFERFYNLIRAKLLEAQIRNSTDLIGEQIRYFSEVRDCWMNANQILGPTRKLAVSSGAVTWEKGGAHIEWSA